MRKKPTARKSRRRLKRIKSVASPSSGEERFRKLIEDLHVGVMILGPHADIQYANGAALNMWGLKLKQVLGKTSAELGMVAIGQDGHEIPFAKRPGPRVIESGKPVRNEVIGFRPPNSQDVIWIYGSAVPQIASDGSVRQIIATMTDVTDRKAAQAALEKAHELNRQILLSVQEGIVVHDLDLRYELWNPFMERMTGLKSEDVLGKHPLELLPFLRESGAYALIEKALRGNVSTALDLPYSVPQTGQAGWCDGDFAPLRNEKNEIVGVMVSVRNVTERKRREDELHELSGRLLQLQDEERRRIARDLHDSFAQGLLAVNMNLAKLGKSGGTLNRSGRQILTETHKIMKGLAKEIRSLSYLLHPPVLDELGLTSAIEEYASGFSRRSGIEAEVEISSELGRLPQEVETALFRIIQESLGNIQRHSGSARAKIELKKELKGLTLKVSDQGHGFSTESVKDETAEPSRLGVGILGMRERMRQLGGRLEIRSGSSGTTVRVALPLIGKTEDANTHTHRG